MPLDPKQQECFGQFLYGAGFYSRDENTLGLVLRAGGGRHKSPQENFCSRCPKRQACEAEHERKVRAEQPTAAEHYDRLIREGRRRGAPEHLLKFLIGRDGRDPFAAQAVENFKRGHADRGREAGSLVR